MRPALLTLSPIALLAACGQAPDANAVLETVRATEESQFQAIASKDLRGAVRNYEDEAVMLMAGAPPSIGPAAIGASYEALLADPNLKVDFKPGQAWVAASGDMAVTTYTADMTMTDPETGQPATRSVTNQTVWRKEAGDPWKIASDYTFPISEGKAA